MVTHGDPSLQDNTHFISIVNIRIHSMCMYTFRIFHERNHTLKNPPVSAGKSAKKVQKKVPGKKGPKIAPFSAQKRKKPVSASPRQLFQTQLPALLRSPPGTPLKVLSTISILFQLIRHCLIKARSRFRLFQFLYKDQCII